MSRSFSIAPSQVKDFAAAADKALADAKESIVTYNAPGLDQAERVIEAAKAIVASGVVGSPGAWVSASLSGHGNPGHLPMLNWANDQVYLSLGQVEPPAT